ncbi:MAG: hypothetical protein ABH807_01920 [Candidatus Shapirobacteria bacterium]
MIKLPPQLPLYYSRPWGEKQLAAPQELLLLPLLCFLVTLLNLTVIRFLPLNDKLISRLLRTTAFLFCLLALIDLIQIIRLVT